MNAKTSMKYQNCIAQQHQQQNMNKNIQSICDESSLQVIKTQLKIHERLHNRYTCGELSHNNMFCHHLECMKETRKSLLKQLERMDVRMVPLPTTH